MQLIKTVKMRILMLPRSTHVVEPTGRLNHTTQGVEASYIFEGSLASLTSEASLYAVMANSQTKRLPEFQRVRTAKRYLGLHYAPLLCLSQHRIHSSFS